MEGSKIGSDKEEDERRREEDEEKVREGIMKKQTKRAYKEEICFDDLVSITCRT